MTVLGCRTWALACLAAVLQPLACLAATGESWSLQLGSREGKPRTRTRTRAPRLATHLPIALGCGVGVKSGEEHVIDTCRIGLRYLSPTASPPAFYRGEKQALDAE